jgi:hypothetical protein
MRTRIRSGAIFGILGVFLLAGLLRIFDLAQQREMLRQAADNLCDELRLVRRLMMDLQSGESRTEIKELLAERYQGEVVKDDGAVTWVDGVGLRFSGDTLVEVISMNARFDCPAHSDEAK